MWLVLVLNLRNSKLFGRNFGAEWLPHKCLYVVMFVKLPP